MGILIFGAKALERRSGTDLGTDIGKTRRRKHEERMELSLSGSQNCPLKLEDLRIVGCLKSSHLPI